MMFRNQVSSTDENKTIHQDLNQKDNYAIEDIPIHTMEKDIQEIENPSLKKSLYLENSMAKAQSPILNDRQQSSPFLNPEKKLSTAPESRPKSSPDYSQINKVIQPTIESASNTESSFNSRIFAISIIILIIFSVGIGAYYYISTREAATTNTPGESDTNTDIKTGIPAPVPNTNEIKNPQTISASQSNNINIDTTTTTPGDFKKILEKTNQEIIASGLQTPIEFLLVDKQNNPIKFSTFAALSGISLSEKFLSLADRGFALFIFYQNNTSGVGLAIKTSDPIALKNQLSQEESQLYKKLAILFPYSDFTPPTTPFQDNKYKNHDVRYQNIISAQKLSIDYAIKGNYLIIATNKPALESLIDKASIQ